MQGHKRLTGTAAIRVGFSTLVSPLLPFLILVDCEKEAKPKSRAAVTNVNKRLLIKKKITLSHEPKVATGVFSMTLTRAMNSVRPVFPHWRNRRFKHITFYVRRFKWKHRESWDLLPSTSTFGENRFWQTKYCIKRLHAFCSVTFADLLPYLMTRHLPSFW